MKIKLNEGSHASDFDIDTLQKKVGVPLKPEFLEFVRNNDGSKPETNIFKVNESIESGVNGFIPVRLIIREMSNIENLPENAFPVAWAEGGNYIFIDQRIGGSVYFWDHEQPENIFKLADGFSQFIDLIDPFDTGSIKLKPNQVKKAWIDPDFLKTIQST
ncbi:SMI1/KNR4 family protein (plasmid) [Methylomonas sp. BW4-1]|uniref:SMI1/KNR4 family protein n=1 Tax=Methylomonas sp. BW4-1 TaxID=3376685 RepID=UPI00404132FE